MLPLVPPLMLVIGVGSNTIDRWAHGSASEGYVLSEHIYANPIDKLLLLCAPHFPLDYCVWLALALYILLREVMQAYSVHQQAKQAAADGALRL